MRLTNVLAVFFAAAAGARTGAGRVRRSARRQREKPFRRRHRLRRRLWHRPRGEGGGRHPLDRGDLSTWLDGLVPYGLKSGDIAGVVVVVVKDGKVLLQKGYGYADVARKTPMDPDTTMIRPGSTSKLFTWTAVMQLVAEGKLDLDRDVNAYLDFKIPHKSGKAITLRDLMNHRAGFEEGLKDLLATDPHGLPSTEQYLKQHPRPLLFTPGQVPAYSNYGAALAGYIVQRVSGEPFAQYVERHIFLPLGMRHATFLQPLPSGSARPFPRAMSPRHRHRVPMNWW